MKDLQGVSIFLIGMMGTGKSTVGQILAQAMNYRFFDTDILIERVANQSINDLFATQGEKSFRDLETEVLAQISAYTRSVIATGGGIVLRQKNWSYLHHGLIIWLDVPVEVLIKRLAEDQSRPLLQTTDLREKLDSLLEQRRSLYSLADLHIKIARQTPSEVVEEILQAIPTVLKDQPMAPSNFN